MLKTEKYKWITTHKELQIIIINQILHQSIIKDNVLYSNTIKENFDRKWFYMKDLKTGNF